MATKPDYNLLSQELATIVAQLQSEDASIDDSLKQYERGLVLIKHLEAYLKTAENKITELQAAFAAK